MRAQSASEALNREPTQREPELLGQIVVVIGGGIGLETARRARAEGASVILAGRNPERLRQAALEVDAQSTAAFDADDPASIMAPNGAGPRPANSTMQTPLKGPMPDQSRFAGRAAP
jgi:NAD(P)-dependent dehydrogenase (short-subunit alcohol dehydrogenase family)